MIIDNSRNLQMVLENDIERVVETRPSCSEPSSPLRVNVENDENQQSPTSHTQSPIWAQKSFAQTLKDNMSSKSPSFSRNGIQPILSVSPSQSQSRQQTGIIFNFSLGFISYR